MNVIRRITRIVCLSAGGLALASRPARATDWKIEPEHSSASFTVRHKMAGNVQGLLGGISGTVHYDEANVSRSTIEVRIDAATIDTRVAERDAHLKSADFFDVARFPVIGFKATRIEKVGKNALRVVGSLTLHGVTKPVELAVVLSEGVAKDTFPGNPDPAYARGQYAWGVTATTTIDRRSFGLTWDIRSDERAYFPVGFVVGNEVSIRLEIELVRPIAAPAH